MFGSFRPVLRSARIERVEHIDSQRIAKRNGFVVAGCNVETAFKKALSGEI